MKHKGQISTDHQPAPRRPAKRDTALSEALHRYAAAVKLAKANGTVRPNITQFVPVK